MFESRRISAAWTIVVLLISSSIAHAEPSSTASLKAANGLLKRGLFDLAEAEYRRVLEDAENGERQHQANYGLAVTLVRQEKIEAATPILAALIALDEFEFAADVAIMLAQCRLAVGDYTDAAQIIADQRLRFVDHPLADDAAALGIEALYRAGQYQACAANAESFMSHYVQSPSAGLVCAYAGLSNASLGEDADAIRLLRTALKFDVPKTHQSHVNLSLAEALARQGKDDTARSAFERVVNGHPDIAARAHMGLALLDWRADDLTAALQSVNLALKNPQAINAALARQLRGRILYRRGAHPEARQDFEWLYQNEQTRNDVTAYWFAKSLLQLGEPKQAASVLSKALQKYTGSHLRAEFRYDLAGALVRLERFDDAYQTLLDLFEDENQSELFIDATRIAAVVAHRLSKYEESDAHIKRWQRFEKRKAGTLPPDLLFVSAENAYLMESFDDAVPRYQQFLAAHATDDRAATAMRRLGLSQYRLNRLPEALESLSRLGEAAHTPASTYAVGDIYFSQRAWAKACQWLSRFVAGNPESGVDDGLIKLGLAHMRQGEFETALERFNGLLQRDADSPHAAQAIFERGQCLLALERFEDAARSFEAVLAKKNAKRLHAPAREHLAALGLKLGNPDLAASYYAELAQKSDGGETQAVAVLRQSDALLQSENFRAAAQAINAFFKNLEDDQAKLSSKTANALQANLIIALARADDCRSAIQQFETLELNALAPPLRLTVEYDFAFCLRKLDEHKRAAEIFQRIARSADANPLRFHALSALTDLAMQRDDFDAAINHVKQLFEMAASTPIPHDLAIDRLLYHQSRAYFELAQPAAALAALGTLIEKHPQSPLLNAAHYLSGESAFALSQWETAAAHFETAIKLAPKAEFISSARLRAGDSYTKLQRWPDAAQQFDTFLNDFPKDEFTYQARFGLAWALENQRQFDDALRHYRMVTNDYQGPTAARAQFQIGQCLFAKKQLETAVSELLKTDILYAYPEWSAAALYEAGRCLEQLQRNGAAREQFIAVTQRFGNTKWATPARERLDALAKPNVPGN